MSNMGIFVVEMSCDSFIYLVWLKEGCFLSFLSKSWDTVLSFWCCFAFMAEFSRDGSCRVLVLFWNDIRIYGVRAANNIILTFLRLYKITVVREDMCTIFSCKYFLHHSNYSIITATEMRRSFTLKRDCVNLGRLFFSL